VSTLKNKPGSCLIHANCVQVNEAGILLRGVPGSGKSDLTLCITERGGSLVADDQVELSRRGAQLIARAPDNISGLIEIRGIGVIPTPFIKETAVALIVDLVPPDQVDRLPEPEFCEILDVQLPLLKLAPFEISAVTKLFLALKMAQTETVTDENSL